MKTTEIVSTFTEVQRVKQAIHYQQFCTVDTFRYRIAIKRDAYDDQSHGTVQMFMLGRGWADVLRVGINQLPNTYEISYVSMPEDVTRSNYFEKQREVREAMDIDAQRILSIVLDIMKR